MKLRLKAFRHQHMKVLVVPYMDMDERGKAIGKPGQALKFSKIGDMSDDIDDRVAYGILSTHGDMLETAGGPTNYKKAVAPANK